MVTRKKTEIIDKNNFERLLFKGIKNWKLFALSFIVLMTIVYLIDRYTPPVYSITSTILLKEETPELAGSAAELLFGNQQFKNSMNLNNESVILSSYPLVYEVIRQLDFNITYYKSGNLKTSEIYGEIPIMVEVDSNSTNIPYNVVFKVEVVDNDQFKIFEEDQNKKQINGLFNFNKEIAYNGFIFKILKNKDLNFNNSIGNTIQFKINTVHAVTNAYRNKLQIRANSRESSLLSITINSRLANKEVDFISKLTEIYIEKGLDEKNRNASRTIEFIDDQLDGIQDSLFVTEQRLETFKRNNGIINLSEEGSYLYDQLVKLMEEKASIVASQKYYKYLQEYLKDSETGSDLVLPSSAGASDPILNKLVLDLIDKQIEKSLIKGESVNNPYVNLLEKQIAKLKLDIGKSLENLAQNSKIQEETIGDRWASLQKDIQRLPTAEREFIHINRMYEINENLYIFLMEKRAEAAILKASTTPDTKIVNPPMVSGAKIAPQTTRNFGVAIVLSFVIPILFLYFKEFFNTKILYKEDIDDVTTIPFLGLVGHESSSDNLIVDRDPRSAVSESFRTVRSNINFFTSEKDKKVILITSSISGEGKTFCSINLSTVVALSGKKTVIVGADLRRPKLFGDFDLNNDIGVSNYLINSASVDEIIQHTKVDNLDLISSGAVPPNPSELLMNKRMDLLIDELKKRYHYIILDTPPIGLVTDALILMKYSDLTVYLVRQNYTPKGSIMSTQEMFENGQLNNISILFNDVKVQKYGYGYGYGYNYGYNSAYYTNQTKTSKSWFKRS
ncbi:MAG: polysaccharide biosynthesis tyrosine autokinase [Fulvivirga sp.]